MTMFRKMIGGLVKVRAHTRRDPPSKKKRRRLTNVTATSTPQKRFNKRKFLDIVNSPYSSKRIPYDSKRIRTNSQI